ISIPRRATTWPKPRPPSRRAITGVSVITVMGLLGFTLPVWMGPAYCGIRMAPCESWPRRLARTSKVATPRASASGAPMAVKMRVARDSSLSAWMFGMASGYRKTEELRGGFTLDEAARARVQPGGGERGEWIRIAHVEGIVAADHHAIGAQLLDDEAEIAGAERQRVHEDPPRILARLLGNGRRPFRPHVPAVVEAGKREGEGAAPMRERDAEIGQALEHAAEDELGDGQRRLQRIADDEGKVVLREPLLAHEGIGRVHEHRHPEIAAGREEREERRIIEVAPARAGADLDRAEPKILAAIAQLLDGQRGVLERHRRHPAEAGGVARHERGHVLVLHPREGLGGPGLGPVAEHDRRRREGLVIDAEAVHVLDAPLRAPRAVVDVAEELIARHDGGAAGVARIEPRPLAAAVARGEVLPARRDQMGVEIDAHYFASVLPMNWITAAMRWASRSQKALNSSASWYAMGVLAFSMADLNSGSSTAFRVVSRRVWTTAAGTPRGAKSPVQM